MAKQPIIDWHRLFGIAVEQDFIDYIILSGDFKPEHTHHCVESDSKSRA